MTNITIGNEIIFKATGTGGRYVPHDASGNQLDAGTPVFSGDSITLTSPNGHRWTQTITNQGVAKWVDLDA